MVPERSACQGGMHTSNAFIGPIRRNRLDHLVICGESLFTPRSRQLFFIIRTAHNALAKDASPYHDQLVKKSATASGTRIPRLFTNTSRECVTDFGHRTLVEHVRRPLPSFQARTSRRQQERANGLAPSSAPRAERKRAESECHPDRPRSRRDRFRSLRLCLHI